MSEIENTKTIEVSRKELIKYLNTNDLCSEISNFIYNRVNFQDKSMFLNIAESDFKRLSENQINTILEVFGIDLVKLFEPEIDYKVFIDPNFYKNNNANKAHIFRALLDRRDEINGDWKPDWTAFNNNYSIGREWDKLIIIRARCFYEHLNFKNEETATKFLEANQELLKIYFEIK